MIELKNGKSICVVNPVLGGSIARWDYAGQSMLRPMETPLSLEPNVLDSACFPLIPFSNRIANGCFRWKGEHIELPLNAPPEPHAHHGIGWQRPWKILTQDSKSTSLVLKHHDMEAWPWQFEARQDISLDNDTLNVALTLINTGAKEMPGGIGLHPYFPRENAVVQFSASAVWENDLQMLPSSHSEPNSHFDFETAKCPASYEVDNVYEGWNGTLKISWPHKPASLELQSNTEVLVLYTPVNAAFFCAEPVSHLTNAVNMHNCNSPMDAVPAGSSLSKQFSFRVCE